MEREQILTSLRVAVRLGSNFSPRGLACFGRLNEIESGVWSESVGLRQNWGELGPILVPNQPWHKIRALGTRLRHEHDLIREERLWDYAGIVGMQCECCVKKTQIADFELSRIESRYPAAERRLVNAHHAKLSLDPRAARSN